MTRRGYSLWNAKKVLGIPVNGDVRHRDLMSRFDYKLRRKGKKKNRGLPTVGEQVTGKDGPQLAIQRGVVKERKK